MEDMDVFIHIKQMTLHYLATKKWKIWIWLVWPKKSLGIAARKWHKFVER
jgi:hypothetical protein